MLLHWTGRTWSKLRTPAASDFISALARDGHGGLWIASVPVSLTCGNVCGDIDMLHRGAAGTWTSTTVRVANLGLTDMRQIPGTQSVWASGNVTGGPDDSFLPVMLKYGP